MPSSPESRTGNGHYGLGTRQAGEIGHLQREPGDADAHDQQMHEFLTALDQRLLEGPVERLPSLLEFECDVGFDQFDPSHRRNSEAQRSIRVLAAETAAEEQHARRILLRKQ